MISDSERAFKEGYLLFPPHGVLGQLKKSWQKKYCQLFRASKYGIERLEIFESEEDAGKTSSIPIITLENCVKITQGKDTQKQQANVFTVVTKSVAHHFAASSEADMLDWITAFQTVAFKDNVSRQTIEEDNDLYCSSGDAGIFSVRLVASEASEKCGLKPGPYTLVVAPSALQLRDVSEQAIILFTWPYRFIRRYGYRSGKFTFEAGRKCESGEGTFHLEHSNQQEIFRCISSKMKSMKKLLTGESLPAIFCGDNQFNAALSMSARSRSPLPPSPTSATSPLLDTDLVHISSVKPLMPVLLDVSDPRPAPRNLNPPLLKPKPEKPPRKNVPVKPSTSSNPPTSMLADPRRSTDANQDLTAYDDVEFRSDAWRTMGVDVMTHTERPFVSEESGKVFIQQTSCNDYDRLQHLGPVSKGNPSADYKQINTIATVASASVSMIAADPMADDDADVMQAVRMADDSHLGYGIIRKKSIPLEDSNSSSAQRPRHTVHNELEYAVVCKPNRV